MDRISKVLLESGLSFIVLFIISKMLGKKQIAQLEFTDYTVGITIGSIAAQMAFDTNFPFYTHIISMIVFAALDIIVSMISRKTLFFKRVLKGTPLILIDDGKIIYQNIKKSKIDINELIAQARCNGFFDISKISACVFEISGNFSFLPKGCNQNVTLTDLNIEAPKTSLTPNLIIDGHLDWEELKKMEKSKQWLMKKLNITSKKEIKNIALATLNANGDIEVHNKK